MPLTKPVFRKPLPVDIDNTLVMWNLSEHHGIDRAITVSYAGYNDTKLIVNQKNVNLVVKLARLGYDIILWSRTGADWAQLIAKHTGLDKHVAAYADKPLFYMDDLPAERWMGERLWRSPETGLEDEG